MAKKKTENIKAAPVLRASDPGSGSSPEKAHITKSYAVRDDWKDKDIVNYVTFKSVNGEVQDLTVNGAPAGGGGSSDGLLITRTRNAEELPCLNKTWNEINTAFTAQLPIMYYKVDTYPTLEAFGYVSRCQYISANRTYYVDVYTSDGTATYLCTNADERPQKEL